MAAQYSVCELTEAAAEAARQQLRAGRDKHQVGWLEGVRLVEVQDENEIRYQLEFSEHSSIVLERPDGTGRTQCFISKDGYKTEHLMINVVKTSNGAAHMQSMTNKQRRCYLKLE